MTLKTGTSTIDNFLNNIISPYHTHNDMCFIKCNKSATINCGCLNMNDSSATTNINTFNEGARPGETDFPRYTSKCIDHTNNNATRDFSMMYFVNPYSDNYINIIHDPDGEVIEEETGDIIPGPAGPLSYYSLQQPDEDPTQMITEAAAYSTKWQPSESLQM